MSEYVLQGVPNGLLIDSDTNKITGHFDSDGLISVNDIETAAAADAVEKAKIRFERAYLFSVTVSDSNSDVVVDASVDISSDDLSGQTRHGKTDENGEYCTYLPEGDYIVTVTSEDYDDPCVKRITVNAESYDNEIVIDEDEENEDGEGGGDDDDTDDLTE